MEITQTQPQQQPLQQPQAPATPPPQQQSVDPTIKALVQAIGRTETGGAKDPYNTKGGSGEYGAYQFMPTTWSSWAKQHLGDANAPMTMENQNKVAYAQVKTLKDKGYNPAQIASIWNSGGPNWEGKVGTNKYGVHYDVPSYVKKVSNYYAQARQADQKTNSQNGSIQQPPNSSQDQADQPIDRSADIFDAFEKSPVGRVIHATGSLTDAAAKASSFVANFNLNPLSLVSNNAPKMSAKDILGAGIGSLGGLIGTGTFGVGTLIGNLFNPSRGLFQGVLEAGEQGGKLGEEMWRPVGESAAEAAPLALAGAGAESLGAAGLGSLSTAGKVVGTGINVADKVMNASMAYEGTKAFARGDYDKAVQLLAPIVAGEVTSAAFPKMMPEAGNSKGPSSTGHFSEDPNFRTGMKVGMQESANNRTPQAKLIAAARKFYGDALNVREADTKAFLKKGRNIDQILDDLREMGIVVDKNPDVNQVDTSKGNEQIQNRLDTQMAIVSDAVKNDPRARISLDDWKKNADSQVDAMPGRSKSEKLEMKDYLEAQFMDLKRAYPDGAITPEDLLLERRQLGNRQIKWDANPREKMQNAVDKQLYHAGNDTLYDAFKGTEYEGTIQKSNEITSRLMDAKTLLDRANGRVVKGGKLGWMWRRTMGFLAGHAIGGPLGGIAGELAAGKIGDYVNNPAWATSRAAKITKKLNAGMGFLDRSTSELVKDILAKKISPAELANRPKALPPGTPVNAATGQMPLPENATPIPLPSPGVLESQRKLGPVTTKLPVDMPSTMTPMKAVIAKKIQEKNFPKEALPKKTLVKAAAEEITKPKVETRMDMSAYPEDVRSIAEKFKAKSDDYRKNVIPSRGGRNQQEKASASKGQGMKDSAILRKLREEPTTTELNNALKYLESNYVGKPVVVDNSPAIVRGTAFGRIKVEFPDGTIKNVDKASVEAPEPRPKDAIAHLKEEAKKQAMAWIGTGDDSANLDNANTIEVTEPAKDAETVQDQVAE